MTKKVRATVSLEFDFEYTPPDFWDELEESMKNHFISEQATEVFLRGEANAEGFAVEDFEEFEED